MGEVQKTLIKRGLEAWCDSEHDIELAKKLHDNFDNLFFRVKGVEGEYQRPLSIKRIKSPLMVTKLCEYEHPDIIITFNEEPIFSIEITNATPYSGANPVQRLPRAVRAAELGIPSIELAPWISNPTPATARGVEARLKIMEIFKVPCLSILFEYNDDRSFTDKFNLLKIRIEESINRVRERGLKTAKSFVPLDKEIIAQMKDFVEKARKENNQSFRQVEIKENYIKINIDLTGKRRYENIKTGWETKGTGLLDPYPGYILAFDFLLCRTGPKISDRKRKIFVHFRKLPRVVKSQKDNPATWWIMKARKSKGFIYWNLIEKFSDGIIFKGETINEINP